MSKIEINNVYKILFTSSPTVFGSHKIPLSEDLPMKPESLYGASKLSSEAYIRAFSHLYKIQSWILRLSNMVGERATHGILYDFIKKSYASFKFFLTPKRRRQYASILVLASLL